MDGILERLIAALQANTAALTAGAGQVTVTPAPAQLSPPVQQLAPAAVTPDTITALIQPHVENAAIKTELGTAMRALGINALPETPPHMLGQLYQTFQAVIARHTGAGAAQPQASASII